MMAGTVLNDRILSLSPLPFKGAVGVSCEVYALCELSSQIQHSCQPNCEIGLVCDTGYLEIRLLRSVRSGERLTRFLPSTEWLVDPLVPCNCGSNACLRMIGGAAVLIVPQFFLHRRPISAHVLKGLVEGPW